MNNTKALTDVDISTSFDNIFANNSGTVRQINKATLFEALESAEDYQALKSEVNTLQESVNGIDTTTDTTLTKTGKAADAKITGDKLAALKEKDDAVDAEIGSLRESLSNNISPNLFNPAVAKANVAISSGDGSEMNGFSGWEATDYIFVSKNDVLYFSSNGKPTPYSTGAFMTLKRSLQVDLETLMIIII